jgi:hypothetical protein
MSPPALACLALVWAALLAARRGMGWLRLLDHPGLAGVALRTLLPVAWLLPPLAGWVRHVAEREGVVSNPLGVAAFAVAQTVTLCAVVYWCAVRLAGVEERLAAERERREDLERLVTMCAWTRKVRWNGEWVSVERYLAERWGVDVTHGMSDEIAAAMEADALAEAGAALAAPEPGYSIRRGSAGSS